MLKVALVGIGAMGRGHLDNYIRLEKEGYPIKLVAICDVDPKRFTNKSIEFNMDVGDAAVDFSKYTCYHDYDEMLEKEDLDVVDMALPTYLHAEAAIKALNKGRHVLCEKPMALNPKECQAMIDARDASGKKLMIAQCLRFWPMYQEIKKLVDSGEFGPVKCAYFFRGGGAPRWSFENWLLVKEKSGGALLDQHIHDVDTINWLFGTPKAVSTSAVNVIPGSGYDSVSTNYLYEDGKVVNAQDDWTLEGGYGFQMIFRVNFEKGGIVQEKGKPLTIFPHEGEVITPKLAPDNGYYYEMKYFFDCVMNDKPIEHATPESTMETIRIACAEIESADTGTVVNL